MKAIVHDRYGPPEVLELREVDTPLPGEGEVMVRVRAASVHADVWHVVAGFPYVLRLMGAGLIRPRNPIPGTDMAGVVEAVGRGVTRFAQGDAVFGETIGKMQWQNGGAWAEYVVVAEESLAPKPANVSFEQAASVPTSGYIALLNLRDVGRVRAGQRVLVNGAAGGVGSLVLQLARAFGARVTGVDHTRKQDLLRSLGADEVIDYTAENFWERDERYDLIVDVASTLTLAQARRVLEPEGTYVIIGHDHYGNVGRRVMGSIPRMLWLSFLSLFVKQLPGLSTKMPTKVDAMGVFAELLAQGRITPIIDKSFPLAEAAAALRYLIEGRPMGKVILTPSR